MSASLEQRMRKLERTNRALWIGLALACGLPVAIAAQRASPDTVECKILRIVDDKGNPRISAGMSPDGPYLWLKTAKDGVQVALNGDDKGPSIIIGDHQAILLEEDQTDGSGVIELKDAKKEVFIPLLKAKP